MRPPTWRWSLSSAACHSGGGLDGAFKGHPLRVDEHTSHPLQTDPSLLGTPASPPSCRARGQSEDPGGSHLPGFQPFPSRNTRPSPPCWLRCPSCREDEVASVLASVGVLAWAPLLCKLGVPRPDGWPVASAQTHVPSHPPPRPTPPPVPAEPRAHPRVCSPACWAPGFAAPSCWPFPFHSFSTFLASKGCDAVMPASHAFPGSLVHPCLFSFFGTFSSCGRSSLPFPWSLLTSLPPASPPTASSSSRSAARPRPRSLPKWLPEAHEMNPDFLLR